MYQNTYLLKRAGTGDDPRFNIARDGMPMARRWRDRLGDSGGDPFGVGRAFVVAGAIFIAGGLTGYLIKGWVD